MIADLIKDKDGKETANIKSEEICKIDHVGKTKKGDLEIEILELKKIEGGVAVLARAWDKGKQFGFGRDGSVDVERFVIMNPPILVEDPNGDILREYDIDGETTQVWLKEDAKASILEVLEHTISVKKQKFLDSNIKPGKIGRTTHTFYSAAGTNSPVDGPIQSPVGTWADAHDGTTAAWALPTSTNQACGSQNNSGSANDFAIYRGIFLFDTSTLLATDTVDSAVFSIYATSVNNEDQDGYNYLSTVQTQGQNISSDADVVVGDWDLVGSAIDNPTEGNATGGRISLNDITTSAYNDFTLNATGLGWVAKTGDTSPVGATEGITYLGLREGHDIQDHIVNNGALSRIFHYYADQGSNEPKLVLEVTSLPIGPFPTHFQV